MWLPVASDRDLMFPDQGGCAGQITREQHRDRTQTEGQRQFAQRTDAAGKLDVPVGKEMVAIVIPEMRRHDAGYPVAAQLLVDRHADAEDVQCPAQYRQSGLISLVEVRCQAFQEKVGGTRCVPRRRCGPGGVRHLLHTTAEGQATGQDRGRKCLQIGSPGQVGVDWLQPPRGFQQQGRRITAPNL